MWSRSPELSPVKLIFGDVYDSEYGLQIDRGTQVLWSRSPELSPDEREFDDVYEYEYGLQIGLMSECRVWIMSAHLLERSTGVMPSQIYALENQQCVFGYWSWSSELSLIKSYSDDVCGSNMDCTWEAGAVILRFVRWNIMSAVEEQSKRMCATIEC